MRIVIALGGNARRGDPMTTEVQRRDVKVATRAIAPTVTAGTVGP
jgi:carbamate kinase